MRRAFHADPSHFCDGDASLQSRSADPQNGGSKNKLVAKMAVPPKAWIAIARHFTVIVKNCADRRGVSAHDHVRGVGIGGTCGPVHDARSRPPRGVRSFQDRVRKD